MLSRFANVKDAKLLQIASFRVCHLIRVQHNASTNRSANWNQPKQSVGAENSTVLGGGGQDTLSISATADAEVDLGDVSNPPRSIEVAHLEQLLE